ncbi:hypothetical protein K501DRAFT_280439 [Backusella circina FSU 941]|nr:hypothetical protein K501DRAFT_280439 [Backusella circina FSU 941]
MDLVVSVIRSDMGEYEVYDTDMKVLPYTNGSKENHDCLPFMINTLAEHHFKPFGPLRPYEKGRVFHRLVTASKYFAIILEIVGFFPYPYFSASSLVMSRRFSFVGRRGGFLLRRHLVL